MYLYIGPGAAVPEEELVGVFDLDKASASKHTRAFLEKSQARGELVSLAEGLPNLFAVTDGALGARVYLTQGKIRIIGE